MIDSCGTVHWLSGQLSNPETVTLERDTSMQADIGRIFLCHRELETLMFFLKGLTQYKYILTPDDVTRQTDRQMDKGRSIWAQKRWRHSRGVEGSKV